MVVTMDGELVSKIRERAYERWIANGSPEGQSEANWLIAEAEILATPPDLSPESRKRTAKVSAKGKLGSRTTVSATLR
jgi:hypothetical protein